MENITKNQKIKNTIIETFEKRKSQSCKVFELKIQQNKLNKKQQEALKMLFVEAKWLYNHILNWSNQSENNNPWNYKIEKFITRKDKDMNDIEQELVWLGSQMKQSIHKQLCSNIKTLSTRKKRGYKIGKLNFIKEYKAINLKQFNHTYKFKNNKVKIQSIPGYLKINGLNQISKGAEFANAKLLNKPNGYYLMVTIYENKKEKEYKFEEIGLDFGVQSHITMSNGKKINAMVQESDRLKRLQRKLSRSQKGSKNRFKLIKLIKIEHHKMTNKKNDLANKVVHEIMQYKNVYMQDENLAGWKIRFGKQIHHSVLGRVKAKLLNHAIILDRYVATTKSCYNCGQIHEIPLNKRVFECDCGIEPEDRDLHAAKNMIYLSKIGLIHERSCIKFKKVPMGYREPGIYTKKPVDIKTSASNSKFDGRSRKHLTEEDSTSLA